MTLSLSFYADGSFVNFVVWRPPGHVYDSLKTLAFLDFQIIILKRHSKQVAVGYSWEWYLGTVVGGQAS